ncbi:MULTISPECIES: hypothetical protein [unclassified Nocardiopsis]|uniref:hypothetical protein n=1 Tax=unclassified Nocardiopsis TaxID=2649073 RepID=UPI00135A5183|nr:MULTISPECIES: hypothetical protein [unclassified Nocardiopsis]
MSPVQIIRTVAAALIAGGGALGLVPGGPCGAGWWSPFGGDEYYAWFALGEPPPSMAAGMCGTAMAPVGSWAIALIVIGAALVAGVWITTSYRPEDKPKG